MAKNGAAEAAAEVCAAEDTYPTVTHTLGNVNLSENNSQPFNASYYNQRCVICTSKFLTTFWTTKTLKAKWYQHGNQCD
jgi:hypothetical protein